MSKTDKESRLKKREAAAAQRKERRERRRMRFWYRTLRRPACGIMRRKFNFHAKQADKQPNNYLLLYNHNTDADFVLTAACMREPMYFVANESILQKGFASRMLSYFFAPIGRVKGTTAAMTVKTILRTLKRGDNVCLAAEGNRSWNGLTCPILFSTGKLAKSSGAALITYRITGGYLTTPRWSYTTRKGRMDGAIVHIYTPEELSSMSADEVNAAINRDLFEDAYARQREQYIAYKGERLAEGMEHALYFCPECGRLGHMHSEDDTLSCECGMKVKYDEYGALSGARFTTIADWDAWQREELRKLIDGAEDDDTILFSDPDAVLYSVNADHERVQCGGGELSMSRAALRVGDHVFPLGEMSGLAIYGRKNMVFEHGGTHYEISSPHRLCCTKYEQARIYITEKRK